MTKEVEFDFSSLLRKTEESVIVDVPKPVKKTIQRRTKASIREKSESTKADQTKLLLPDLQPEDLEIFKILAKKYKRLGTNVVRHNQKNPFVQDLARLAYVVQDINAFKQMYKEGLLKKTKYSSQWSIR